MGFTPGEGLGKKRKVDDEPEASTSELPRGGIASGAPGGGLASRPAAPPAAAPKPRTEPIKFTMRDGPSALCTSRTPR